MEVSSKDIEIYVYIFFQGFNPFSVLDESSDDVHFSRSTTMWGWGGSITEEMSHSFYCFLSNPKRLSLGVIEKTST